MLICGLIMGLYQAKMVQGKLEAQLAAQAQLTEQYYSLAEHRRAQLDALHALIVAHNARVEADQETLTNYQHAIGELEDYVSTQMADAGDYCLSDGDVERLRQLWQTPSPSHSR